MLDIRLIRSNSSLVHNNLKRRSKPEYLTLFDNLLIDDQQWRQTLTHLNNLRHKKNRLTVEIANLKKSNQDATDKITTVGKLTRDIETLERSVESLEFKTQEALMNLPNLLHDSVPFGEDDSDNVVIKKFGRPPVFNFKPKNHLELAIDLDMIDLKRAAKTSGHGFYYLKGALARLDYAIITYTIDFLTQRGFTLIEPPFLLRKKPYLGATDLEFFGDQLYKIQNEDLYLIATSEHPMAAFYMDEVLLQEDLPVKLAGVSTNFRKEVGAHGRYTRGLFRVHQFNKVEQFIFCEPEDSWKYHEELEANSEDLYRSLNLCFRVVNVCTGDIGTIAAKKYDIEAWMADGKYREVGSNSNCTDYQARRLNIKYRKKTGQAPIGVVHTLNNTGLATARTMIAILEQNQQADGCVNIPKVLHPYMNGLTQLCKN